MNKQDINTTAPIARQNTISAVYNLVFLVGIGSLVHSTFRISRSGERNNKRNPKNTSGNVQSTPMILKSARGESNNVKRCQVIGLNF
jgi:hypothetical protein